MKLPCGLTILLQAQNIRIFNKKIKKNKGMTTNQLSIKLEAHHSLYSQSQKVCSRYRRIDEVSIKRNNH
jgi:hypothetical protein